MRSIDLNADLGEGGGADAALLAIVSSCNIACGGHAGDAATMQATVAEALRRDVVIGAHPAYPDREGFGRVSGFLAGAGLYDALSAQVERLAGIVAVLGGRLAHVKVHGALYNDAVADEALAEIVARVTVEAPGRPSMVGMAGTALERAARRHGLDFIAEAFIDRAYAADGTLVPRSQPGAVHESLNVITAQAVQLARHGRVTASSGDVIAVAADTLCVHGDTPGAAAAARAVRDVLTSRGVQIRAVADR